jgi:hypothetical protein
MGMLKFTIKPKEEFTPPMGGEEWACLANKRRNLVAFCRIPPASVSGLSLHCGND